MTNREITAIGQQPVSLEQLKAAADSPEVRQQIPPPGIPVATDLGHETDEYDVWKDALRRSEPLPVHIDWPFTLVWLAIIIALILTWAGIVGIANNDNFRDFLQTALSILPGAPK